MTPAIMSAVSGRAPSRPWERGVASAQLGPAVPRGRRAARGRQVQFRGEFGFRQWQARACGGRFSPQGWRGRALRYFVVARRFRRGLPPMPWDSVGGWTATSTIIEHWSRWIDDVAARGEAHAPADFDWRAPSNYAKQQTCSLASERRRGLATPLSKVAAQARSRRARWSHPSEPCSKPCRRRVPLAFCVQKSRSTARRGTVPRRRCEVSNRPIDALDRQ